MTNIATLRKMVNNGWTIANRKNILAHIDKSDLKDLTIAAKKSGIDIDDLKFDMFESHLRPKLHKTFLGDEMFIEEDFCNLEQMKSLIKTYQEVKMLPNNASWNSEKFLLFKLLNNNYTCQNDNIKIILGTDNKIHTKLKDLLFKTCKPLGRTEIHYRKEGFSLNPYSANSEIHQKLFEGIDSLKVGDTYKPKTFLWTSNNKASTEIYGRGEKIVHYEIVYPPESKILEYPYKTLYCGDITEAISPRDSAYKILEKINDGDNIFIKMQLII